ncbi:dual specificity protein phosphatase family protein [Brucella ciceri]|uniref:dual specificity protein phosphatase family protein n=1 Tax=Brucella ciceri TaxID=391287 RepID=UPI0013B03BD0|nr:dual specificity protein phosphatase family protein [Brucella ciceri]MCH6206298.1 dual specificity protein phosphatase family protein [Brucella ciceri]
MVQITVSSLRQAIERNQEFDAVLSIENIDRNLVSLTISDGRPHLTLRFNDIDWDDELSATSQHLVGALSFYMDFSLRGEGHRLLIHCHAGRCRSPAIALLCIAWELGAGRENEAVEQVLSIVPSAALNLHVLQLADDLLNRHGDLVRAWEPHEAREDIKRVRLLKRHIYERIQRARNR